MSYKFEILTFIVATFAINIKMSLVMGFCKDWTICQRVDCAQTKNPCPTDKPYLVYDGCGCCSFCSEKEKTGPCGTCGKDLVCKENNLICKKNQIISIDFCGCCRVCKTVIGEGSNCSDRGPSFTVCAEGLKCINGICKKSCKKY